MDMGWLPRPDITHCVIIYMRTVNRKLHGPRYRRSCILIFLLGLGSKSEAEIHEADVSKSLQDRRTSVTR